MVELQRISPVWTGSPCVVAAPGPSLTEEVCERVRIKHCIGQWRVLVVQDAYRVLPLADVLYGSCPSWWRHHSDAVQRMFWGEKWSTHEDAGPKAQHHNDKTEFAALGLKLVRGRDGKGFSTDPEFIHYGSNSGFQAINLALLLGSTRIVLVGFDMRCVSGESHFFGDHPAPLHQNKDTDYRRYNVRFERAARLLSSDVCILNATPGSALTCFPVVNLDDALGSIPRTDRCVHRDGTEPHATAG